MQFLPAGALPRPASDTPEAALREFPYGLIRVLDEHRKAIGACAPTPSAATLRMGLRAVMLTRPFDERMHAAQKIGSASCRANVSQSVDVQVVPVVLHKQSPSSDVVLT